MRAKQRSTTRNAEKMRSTGGDLGCIEARLCADEEGNTWYHVLIEEASPGSNGLIQFVMTYLAEREFPGVEVETAW